jgi:hypothetical protein
MRTHEGENPAIAGFIRPPREQAIYRRLGPVAVNPTIVGVSKAAIVSLIARPSAVRQAANWRLALVPAG